MSIKKENILLLISLGSEIRQFFYSGIINSLQLKGVNIFVVIRNNDTNLTNLVKKINPKVKVLQYEQDRLQNRYLGYLRLLLDRHFKIKNKTLEFSSPKKKRIYSIIDSILHLLPKDLISSLHQNELNLYRELNLKNANNLLSDNSIDKILANGFTVQNPPLLFASLKLNIPVYCLCHSNKDVVYGDRIRFPFAKIGLWNDEMKNQYLGRYKNQISLEVIGNTHFLPLISSTIEDQELFMKKYKIEPNSKVFFYTSAGTNVKNEYLYVKELDDALQKEQFSYKIIVRQNPMDLTDVWSKNFDSNDRIFIQKPKWVTAGRLNYTLPDDIIEYKSLLFYSDFCINIPSTVTIEAAIMKLPVINIAYDKQGAYIDSDNVQISNFWDYEYYRQFHNYDFVKPLYYNMFEVLDMTNNSEQYNDYDDCIKDILSDDLSNILEKQINFILS